MELLGIRLRKPSLMELTAAAVMTAGLWIAGVGVWHASGRAVDASEAGAALLVLGWSCSATRIVVHLDRGGRHLAFFTTINMLLLALYHLGCVVFG